MNSHAAGQVLLFFIWTGITVAFTFGVTRLAKLLRWTSFPQPRFRVGDEVQLSMSGTPRSDRGIIEEVHRRRFKFVWHPEYIVKLVDQVGFYQYVPETDLAPRAKFSVGDHIFIRSNQRETAVVTRITVEEGQVIYRVGLDDPTEYGAILQLKECDIGAVADRVNPSPFIFHTGGNVPAPEVNDVQIAMDVIARTNLPAPYFRHNPDGSVTTVFDHRTATVQTPSDWAREIFGVDWAQPTMEVLTQENVVPEKTVEYLSDKPLGGRRVTLRNKTAAPEK